MAETLLHIAGRQYPLRCRDGDEPHMARLALMIEEKAKQAQQATPGLTEVRSLLFAALFLADELNDLRREAAGRQEQLALEAQDDRAADAIDAITARLEKLHAQLAETPVNA